MLPHYITWQPSLLTAGCQWHLSKDPRGMMRGLWGKYRAAAKKDELFLKDVCQIRGYLFKKDLDYVLFCTCYPWLGVSALR